MCLSYAAGNTWVVMKYFLRSLSWKLQVHVPVFCAYFHILPEERLKLKMEVVLALHDGLRKGTTLELLRE